MQAIYDGPLDQSKMDKAHKRAYTSWLDQRHRCNSKKSRLYKYYGARGIKVKYSSREFIHWWVQEFKFFVGKTPTVDRINNDGNYEFGNIQLLDISENVKKQHLKNGNPTPPKPVFVFDKITNEYLGYAANIKQAAKMFGTWPSTVSNCCNGKCTPKGSYMFRFCND